MIVVLFARFSNEHPNRELTFT